MMWALQLGLTEQGLYRVNGNTRLINELKNTFDKSEFVYIDFGLHLCTIAMVTAVMGMILNLIRENGSCVINRSPKRENHYI